MIARLALVGLGGMIGALLRYGAGGVVHRLYEGRFPLGTLLINITGCMAIGLLFALAEDRGVLSAHARLRPAVSTPPASCACPKTYRLSLRLSTRGKRSTDSPPKSMKCSAVAW